MGTGAELAIAAGLTAAGTGAQAYNSYQTAKREDKTAALGIRQQAARQREADSRVAQQVDQLRASTPEAARQAASNSFLEQLRRNRAQAIDAGTPGATSAAYREDAGQAQDDVAAYGARTAGNLARISAPDLQREREGQGFARTGSDLAQIGRNARGDAFLQQLRQQAAGQRNPFLDVAGSLLTGAGNAYATKAPATKAAKVPKGGLTRYDAPPASFSGAFA